MNDLAYLYIFAQNVSVNYEAICRRSVQLVLFSATDCIKQAKACHLPEWQSWRQLCDAVRTAPSPVFRNDTPCVEECIPPDKQRQLTTLNNDEIQPPTANSYWLQCAEACSKSKVKKGIAVCRQLTCHMGSHSVTCHPAEVTFCVCSLI